MDEYLSTRTQSASRPSGGPRLIVGAVLAAFLLGAAATWYMTVGADQLAGIFTFRSDDTPRLTEVPGPRQATASPSGAQAASLDPRVVAMEQRMARLNLQVQAAEGNAARAEGLLIAFATRRAIERGAPLGYLADQLRVRFGEARPNAVRTVIEAARHPVTLDQLLARLDGLEPKLAAPPTSEGTLGWVSRQVGSLFVVRREDAPSPAPARRIERARLFLESGRIDAAISEVRMMPGAAAAGDWLADAERYAAAQRALETLETAAVLEPRALRDGAGQPVEQPSPLITP